MAGLAGLAETKARLGLATPQVSIWYVATRKNIAELPELVRLAARVGVPEVYLQRMVFFAGTWPNSTAWPGTTWPFSTLP